MSMEEFRIEIPETLGDKSLCPFFVGWNWFDDPQSPIVLDFSRCEFVAPWAATLFGAYGRWLQDVRGKVVDVWIDDSTAAGQYLCRAGIHQIMGKTPPDFSYGSPNRIFPLTQLQTSKEIQSCVSSVMQILQVEDEEMENALRYGMIELLRNVVQHSHSRIGAIVHAVYFPNTGIVDLAIADIGCGIRAALRDRYREIRSDYKAVKFAMQPHVSGTFARGAYQSMASNAGLGLFFIKEIATRSGGGFFLGSGMMLADLWGNLDGSP